MALAPQTGIELPGETRGLTKPVNRWSKVSIGAISMGQEIGVTPDPGHLAWSRPLRTMAFIRRRESSPASFRQTATPKPVVFHPAQQHRVVSPMTAAQMKKMMEGVVLFGTARRAILDGYTVGRQDGHGAEESILRPALIPRRRYVASFIGFSPVNTPAMTIAVILDSPSGCIRAGRFRAPVFKRIAEQVLEYMHVPHDVDVKTAADDDGIRQRHDWMSRPTGWARVCPWPRQVRRPTSNRNRLRQSPLPGPRNLMDRASAAASALQPPAARGDTDNGTRPHSGGAGCDRQRNCRGGCR